MPVFFTHCLETKLPETSRGAVVAIGNFDGVHRGHQAVLDAAMAEAKGKDVSCLVLSFEPHPRTLFRPQSPVFRLTPGAMKARVLQAAGLDGLLTLPFTKELASTDAGDFIARYLLDYAGASHVVCGYNFHFGKNRVGSPQFLQGQGSQQGFGVTVVEPRADETEEPVSSSRIRRLLGDGDASAAADLLGYRWCIGGVVVKGRQLGRTLGYPTANLKMPDNCRLAHGIYAVRLRMADGTLRNGVASYGRRPTFDDGAPLLETFVFDFDGDLYEQSVEVTLFEYLRPEEKFGTVDALVVQMKADEQRARAILADVSPLSVLDEKISFTGLTSS